jgi:polysaccharide export outer membrane protein
MPFRRQHGMATPAISGARRLHKTGEKMSMLRRLAQFLLMATLGVGLTGGCTSLEVTTNPRVPGSASSALLRPGDSLTIALQGIPDPSAHNVQVDEQGLVNLPYIGSVTASGLTSAELSQRIRQTYIVRNYYTTVDVSVAVTERYVYVGGEVSHPGRIVWAPDLTLTKAIQAAGGFTLYARETKVALVRDRVAYDLDADLAQRKPEQDPHLVPGDSIQVPRSPF